ncbi:MAG: hypothetical protein JWP44_3839 [Mucilaginibacter sp.]|nr:hypothetical protein [Mucilaginibacter sp.]
MAVTIQIPNQDIGIKTKQNFIIQYKIRKLVYYDDRPL